MYSGSLEKCGTQWHSWKQRFFHLVDDKLSYYDDNGRRSKEKGSMTLTNRTVTLTISKRKNDKKKETISIHPNPLIAIDAAAAGGGGGGGALPKRGLVPKIKGFISTKVRN